MNPSPELLARLLAAAVKFSGLPAIGADDMPPVLMLSNREFVETVCASAPGRCISLVAAFDTQRYRIVVRDSLDLDQPSANSFIVHELVHVLQYKRDGQGRFTSCEAVLVSEREAYDAQNLYLQAHNVHGREGTSLRYMRCPPKDREDASAESR